MSKQTNPLVLKVEIPAHVKTPTRFDIWVDPVRGTWCIAVPPDGFNGTALMGMQVDGPTFIAGLMDTP